MYINKAYKVRLYPNKIQEQRMKQVLGATRFVWNYYLNKRKTEYAESKTQHSYASCCKDLTGLKRQEQYRWLNEAPARALQQSLRDLDIAYRKFIRKEQKCPKFKSRHEGTGSFRTPSAWKIIGNKIRIVEELTIRYRGTELVGIPKSITVSLDTDGKWYASIVTQQEIDPQEMIAAPIGVDLGLTHLAITSDGKKYDTFRPKRTFRKRIKSLQQNLARKQKGSNNRSKVRHRLALLHKSIRNQRKNYLHHVSHRITSENQALIVCEDLSVKTMVKNHKLAEAIHESGWSELVRQIEYKQTWRGGQFIKIDRFFPSSKTCANCGVLFGKLPLSIRHWTCSSCNTEHDRDINAAKMILQQGLSNSRCVESTESILSNQVGLLAH